MAPQPDVLKKSVTKDDYTDNAGRTGAIIHFWMPAAAGGLTPLPPYPPPYWSFARDDMLRQTIYADSLWASAIYIAVTKIAALSWDVKGDIALQIRRMQELLLQADSGRGWVRFIQKHLRDFLLTDNGAFIEIVRTSAASGSKIIGLVPLDSRKCTRTGDPDIPIIYRDKKGREHQVKNYQLIEMSDMPDPTENYFGVGLCAASRAYKAIYKMSALETYVAEKISGRRPLAIHFVNNISNEQLQEAIRETENQANQQGRTTFMGVTVVPNIDPSVTPAVATIELAGLPDGFDAPTERKSAILVYADAIGVDPQELDPELLASKSMGTGAQSRVIDDKASSRGLIAYRQGLTHSLNWDVFPARTWFYFHERDFRDQKQRADIDATLIDNVNKMIQGGQLEDIEGRQYLVDHNVLEREYMPIDITPTSSMSDTDKIPPEAVSEEERLEFIAAAQQAKLDQEAAEAKIMTDAQTPPTPPGQVSGNRPPVKKKESTAMTTEELMATIYLKPQITVNMPAQEPAVINNVVNVPAQKQANTIVMPARNRIIVRPSEVKNTILPAPVAKEIPAKKVTEKTVKVKVNKDTGDIESLTVRTEEI